MLTQAQAVIRDELLQEKAIYKYKYGSDVLDAWLTETLASLLSTNCSSIFEIGKIPTTFVFSASTYSRDDDFGDTNFVSQVDKTIDGFNYYNKKTGTVFVGVGGSDSNKPNTLSLSDGSPGFDPLLFASTESVQLVLSNQRIEQTCH